MHSANGASQASLFSEAKKEGKVVYYTALTLPDAISLTKAFEEKYRGIKVELFRAGSQGVVSKVTGEFRARRHLFDVVSINSQVMNTFKELGILGSHISPERKEYPEALMDADGYWTGIYSNVYVIAYNKKLAVPEEVPKSYEDLANPKWRGKILKDRTVPQWFAYMVQQLGREQAINQMKKLAANDLVYRNGSSLVTQLIIAGEAPIGFPLKGQEVEQWRMIGAPIDWYRPEPTFFSSVGMGVAGQAPHPHAAKLFVDFVLSEEGQDNLAVSGRTPTRKGIRHKMPRLTEGAEFSKAKVFSTKEYAEMNRLYREVFK